MAYLVNVLPRAERDLEDIYTFIQAEDSAAAQKWFRGLVTAILTLESSPARGSATREDPKLHQLLYGRKPHTYRVIYRIIESRKLIQVLHIRHGARDQQT